MNWREDFGGPPPAFEEYVETVLRGFSPGVRTRVRAEVREHVEQAYEANREEGRTPSEAIEEALRDLGPAPQVRRAYLMSVLTREEEEALSRVRWKDRTSREWLRHAVFWGLGSVVVLLVLRALPSVPTLSTGVRLDALAVLVGGVAAVTALFRAWCVRVRPPPFRVPEQLLFELCLSCAVVALYASMSRPDWASLFGYGVWIVVFVLPDIWRLRRLLWRWVTA